MIWLLTSPVWLLWPLYIVGIQIDHAKKGGWWQLAYLVFPVTKSAFILDVVMNYTLLALYTWDWPQKGEFTFSKRLERLVLDSGWRGKVACFIEVYMLNWADPDGFHIKRNP